MEQIMRISLNRKQQKLINLFASVGIYVLIEVYNTNSDLIETEILPPTDSNLLRIYRRPKEADLVCSSLTIKQVLNSILKSKTLGLGESYIKGLFTCQNLEMMLNLLAKTDEFGSVPVIDKIPNSLSLVNQVLLNKVFNFSYFKQLQVAEKHYDLPDVLFTGINGEFTGMLGETLKYTCGDWKDVHNYYDSESSLNSAQKNSLQYIIDQIGIHNTPGIPVILDCGCGWGSVPKYLLETMGEGNFIYIGVTIAQNQVDSCKARFEGKKGIHFFNHSFNDPFEPILARLGIEKVDGVIFLGSLEHAGPANTKSILANIRQIVIPGGKIYIQIVGSDHPTPLLDPYIWKYIFPNTVIMSPGQIGSIIENNRLFRLVKMDNIYHDYYRTLMAWNFIFQKNWFLYEEYIANILDDTSFATTEEWKRHWEFYLLLCASFYQAGTYPQLYRITLETNLNTVDQNSWKQSFVKTTRKFLNV
jgi:cyclopropane-fatty-acyl-phospholipid synthase